MKKVIAVLICGIFITVQPALAYIKRKQYIYQPVVYTYSCKVNNEKCSVTEHTYMENGVSHYKAVCTGDHMNVRRLENIVKSDVQNKRRRYCEVDL